MTDYEMLKAMLEKVGKWHYTSDPMDNVVSCGSGEGAEFTFDNDGNLVSVD